MKRVDSIVKYNTKAEIAQKLVSLEKSHLKLEGELIKKPHGRVRIVKTDEAEQQIKKLEDRLDQGRHYLMGAKADEITAAAALDVLGFGENGLKEQ